MMGLEHYRADAGTLAYFEQLWPQFRDGLWFVTTSDEYAEMLQGDVLRPALPVGTGGHSYQLYSDDFARGTHNPVLFDFSLLDADRIGLPALLALWRDCLPAEAASFVSAWLEIDRRKVALTPDLSLLAGRCEITSPGIARLRQEIAFRPAREVRMSAVRRALFVGV